MINHKHKFIFIHIPKNAGHSIDIMFREMGMVDEERWHDRSIDIIERFGKKMWDNYLSFSTVRNPWDRFLSEYIWQKSYSKEQIQIEWGNKDISFVDFCKSDFAWYPEIEKSHLTTQLNFLTDVNGIMCVDEIVRFENLQKDFDRVCDKIGIPHQKIPHKNKTEHKPYWEYYNDETREIVAKKFEEDINTFGYEFGK